MEPFVFQVDENDERDDMFLSVEVRCVTLNDEDDVETINNAVFGRLTSLDRRSKSRKRMPSGAGFSRRISTPC